MGQVVALFERELAKVLSNIADDNTDAKASRSIVLTAQDQARRNPRNRQPLQWRAIPSWSSVKRSKSYAILSYDGKKVRAYQSDPRQALLTEIAVEEAKANGGEVRTVDFTGARPALARG